MYDLYDVDLQLSNQISLFYEIGPLQINSGQVYLRNESWNQNHDLLFIDNPVGTGYSQVVQNNDCLYDQDRNAIPETRPIYCRGYAMNQAAVSKDLTIFLLKFYNLFPETKSLDLYLGRP